jgi:hypothetical protein
MSCDFETFVERICLLRTESLELALLLLPIFRDIHNLMLEDEKIRSILARYAHHVLVVVFDPASDHFAVSQLQAHDFLLFSKRFEIGRLFKRFVGRRRALLAKVGISLL